MDALRKEKHYTYADYAGWDTEERYELIDGVPYLMASPSWQHQTISGEIFLQLANFLKDKPCKVFTAPLDVLLNGTGNSDDTVVQPDIVVICDRKKLGDGRYVNGAPDFVVEILSPSSSLRDMGVKFNKYQQSGVREYWVVNPEQKTLIVYTLEDGRYVAATYAAADTAPVRVLEGCTVSLADVFAEI